MEKEYKTDKEVIIKRTDTTNGEAGAGWAVALVVLILAIGFAFVVFSNNEAMKDLRIGQSIDQLKQQMDDKTNTPQTPLTPPIQVQTPAPAAAPSAPPQVNVQMPPSTPAASSSTKSEPANNPAPSDLNSEQNNSTPSDSNQ